MPGYSVPDKFFSCLFASSFCFFPLANHNGWFPRGRQGFRRILLQDFWCQSTGTFAPLRKNFFAWQSCKVPGYWRLSSSVAARAIFAHLWGFAVHGCCQHCWKAYGKLDFSARMDSGTLFLSLGLADIVFFSIASLCPSKRSLIASAPSTLSLATLKVVPSSLPSLVSSW